MEYHLEPKTVVVYHELFKKLNNTRITEDCSKDVFKVLLSKKEEDLLKIEQYIASEEFFQDRIDRIVFENQNLKINNIIDYKLIDIYDSNIVFYIEFYRLLAKNAGRDIEYLCSSCNMKELSF